MPAVDYEGQLETRLERIEQSDEIHPDNKERLQKFVRGLEVSGMSSAWMLKLTAHLKILAEHLGDTRFEDLDKEDIKDLVAWVQRRDIAPATVGAYKQVMKRFWRWLNGGEHPDETAWINTKRNSGNGTLPKDLLTREDVDVLLDACRNPRDAALIALLWETGARIGELIDLTVGDIEDHQHGRKVVVEGKTGPRRLVLVESVPYLNRWVNQHPKPEADAPLWCKLQQGSGEERVSYNYIRQKILQRAAERADLDKPVNPHHFRHSRASYLANHLKEAQLCEWFGWVQGSDLPARYVHLSGRDIDQAYGALHGLEPEDGDEQEESVVSCPRCEELNEPEARFCARCGQALELDAAAELETAEVDVAEAAGQEDVELALELVKLVRDDREAFQKVLNRIEDG
jgi:site-specific recombinase XerD